MQSRSQSYSFLSNVHDYYYEKIIHKTRESSRISKTSQEWYGIVEFNVPYDTV